MNSLGSSSKWPSYDSLPSTSSFLLSESEQTEDEADVFSEGEGDGGIRNPLSAKEAITLSGNYLHFPPRPDQLHSESEQCADKSKCHDSASSARAASFRASSATPGDLAFAQKCEDLHRFIHPLLELLHGLQTGRFDRGLTSFQQSVAMDRLQRILGVLQKPEMGEKYLQSLLQIEVLLKMWFPLVAFKTSGISSQANTPELSTHWCKNQLHMPVKKRKLSWSNPDQAGEVQSKDSHNQHGKRGRPHDAPSLDTASARRPGSPKKFKPLEPEAAEPGGDACTAGEEFTDGAGRVSGPPRLCFTREKDISLPSSCGSPATQDNAVSSSDTVSTTDSP
ncbi:circadian associated repressor of transcription a [Salarias fasciatus]|uniref:circadian associated repressor of transcription a n=1 Tax=Salarias fasciatus TaxID=181472 RepID=UPI0011768E7F|nr:circadian-associated transcriptional repressor-like [Salarias fasciatus]